MSAEHEQLYTWVPPTYLIDRRPTILTSSNVESVGNVDFARNAKWCVEMAAMSCVMRIACLIGSAQVSRRVCGYCSAREPRLSTSRVVSSQKSRMCFRTNKSVDLRTAHLPLNLHLYLHHVRALVLFMISLTSHY
jgi:hypothetical protein